MKIYIASKANHRPYWRRLRDMDGLPINSRWIDVDDKFSADPAELDYEQLWDWCLEDVRDCDALVVFADHDEVLKGAILEVGAALALGKRVIAVGAPQYFLANGSWLHQRDIDHRWVEGGFVTVKSVIEELVREQEG